MLDDRPDQLQVSLSDSRDVWLQDKRKWDLAQEKANMDFGARFVQHG